MTDIPVVSYSLFPIVLWPPSSQNSREILSKSHLSGQRCLEKGSRDAAEHGRNRRGEKGSPRFCMRLTCWQWPRSMERRSVETELRWKAAPGRMGGRPPAPHKLCKPHWHWDQHPSKSGGICILDPTRWAARCQTSRNQRPPQGPESQNGRSK